MSTYSLTIKIPNPDVVKGLNRGRYVLCFARGVNDNSGSTPGSVVATIEKAAASITITWEDEYSVAGTTQAFSAGTTIVATTNILPVVFQQQYHVDADMVGNVVNATQGCPKTSFQFKNDPPNKLSVLVYQKVGTEMTPVYISPLGPQFPGIDTLTPVPTVRVWFQQNITTGTMISDNVSDPCNLNYLGTTAHTVNYDGNYWTIIERINNPLVGQPEPEATCH